MDGNNTAVSLAALTLASAVVAGLFKLLNNLTKSLDANTKSNKDIAKKTERVANATEKGNKEAKERNGHLAELVIQSTQQGSDNLKAVAEAATDKIIKVVQNVEVQKVQHQVIKESEVKEEL